MQIFLDFAENMKN